MVVLNDFLPINISSLKIHISNKIRDILDDQLDYFIETSSIIKKNDKKRIFDNIIKEVKNSISSDYFLYLVMHDNYCVYKYKKGRKEGQYCAKKIRSNNPKKSYLCCQHDKGHIPKKKEIKRNCNNIDNTCATIEIKSNYDDIKVIEEINSDNDSNIYLLKEKSKNKNDNLGDLQNQEKKVKEVDDILKKDKYNKLNKIYKNPNDENKINKNYNDSIINNNINNNYVEKTIKTNKLDKINKYTKRCKWKKLDIIYDTGFVFG